MQTCIVHLIRASLRYVNYRDRKKVAAALRPIYTAPNADARPRRARALRRRVGRRATRRRVQAWRDAWEHVIPFLALPEELRRAVYTTNTIEGAAPPDPQGDQDPRPLPRRTGRDQADLPRDHERPTPSGRRNRTWTRSPRRPQDPLRRPLPRLTTTTVAPASHTEGRTASRWLLDELDPTIDPAGRSLDNFRVLDRVKRQLAKQPPSALVRICREFLARIRELTVQARAIARDLKPLVQRHAAPLLALPGVGIINAARLLAEVADIRRFRTDAQLALYAGVAPLDASSGRQRRHRLNRTGNRQLNAALHMIALTQARLHPPAQAYLARRRADGKTGKEALRALKRHLIRILFRLLNACRQPRACHRSRRDRSAWHHIGAILRVQAPRGPFGTSLATSVDGHRRGAAL